MAERQGVAMDRFSVEDTRLYGWKMRFICIKCGTPVTEAAYFQGCTMPESARFYLRCHERSTMVDIPMQLFIAMPKWPSMPTTLAPSATLRFIVGFHGTWSIHLRNYDWLLAEPQPYAAAVGVFEQEQLQRLFEYQVLSGYHFDSEFFNIVNNEHDFEFPAEHWFPTWKRRLSAQDSVIRFA